eukprot:1147723-Pelagomonas_calceolata.AAC.6
MCSRLWRPLRFTRFDQSGFTRGFTVDFGFSSLEGDETDKNQFSKGADQHQCGWKHSALCVPASKLGRKTFFLFGDFLNAHGQTCPSRSTDAGSGFEQSTFLQLTPHPGDKPPQTDAENANTH